MKQLMMCLGAAMLIPGGLRGQPPGTTAARTIDAKSMYEDVEIMRRLLSRQFPAHQVGGFQNFNMQPTWNPNNGMGMGGGMLGMAGASGGMLGMGGGGMLRQPPMGIGGGMLGMAGGIMGQPNANTFYPANYSYSTNAQVNQSPGVTFEGVYLKGHGVAFTASVRAQETLHLSTPEKSVALVGACGKCHEDTAIRKSAETPNAPTTKPLSDWEKVQREVRGTKEEPKPQTRIRFRPQDICVPGNLSEIFLKILAENGHHFKQLTDHENITIAITLSGSKKPESSEAKKSATDLATALKAAQDQASIGDLHFKQDNDATAEKSYADAIKKLVSQPLTLSPDVPSDASSGKVDEATRYLSGLYAKYAQVLLRLNKLNEAKDATAKSIKPELKVALATASTEAKPIRIRSKLLVSVSKKAMDDIHAGKIDMAQFRKLAEVQTIDPSSAKR